MNTKTPFRFDERPSVFIQVQKILHDFGTNVKYILVYILCDSEIPKPSKSSKKIKIRVKAQHSMVKVESSLFLYKLSIRIQYDSSNGFLVFLTQSHFHDELKIVDLNISSYIKCNLICTFIFCETR